MECFPNAHICFCAEHRFCRSRANSALTCGWGCDMINVLGRIFPPCFSFSGARRPGNEMTPDRIGQGSFLFLGLNHWVTSLSMDSDRGMISYSIESLPQYVVRSAVNAFDIYVKRKNRSPGFSVWPPALPPFFVVLGYHISGSVARRHFNQITSV